MLYITDLDMNEKEKHILFSSDNLQEYEQVNVPNNYKEEIDIYKDIFDETILDDKDYTIDNDGVMVIGENKHNWREINFQLPIVNKNKKSFIEFKLDIYLKAPLFSIFAVNKNDLYKEMNLVINVWPFMHTKKFIRNNVTLITKMSPTVDIMDFPIRFKNPESWSHIHSEKYFFSRKSFTVRNHTISNYFGNYFTWSIHQYHEQPIKIMFLTYEFISTALRRKFVRTCALGIFDAKLTQWINNDNNDKLEGV